MATYQADSRPAGLCFHQLLGHSQFQDPIVKYLIPSQTQHIWGYFIRFVAKVIRGVIFHCFWVIWKIRTLFFGWPECSSLVEQKHWAGSSGRPTCSSQRAGFWLDDGVDAGDWLAGACWWKVHCSHVIYAGIISICHSLMWKTNHTCGYRSCHLSAGTCGGRTGGLLPSCAVNSLMSFFMIISLQKHPPWLPRFMTKHHNCY